MNIKNNTICFKSNNDAYIKEKLGLKQNTVRIFNDLEKSLFIKNIKTILYIRICNSFLKDCFCRQISDISIYDELIIFSWVD